MKQVVQFFGNKIVCRPCLSRSQIQQAEHVVSEALAGRLKFAWRRVSPTRHKHITAKPLKELLAKDQRTLVGRDYEDVAKHKRAERWNARNAHTVFPSAGPIKSWKLNCTRLKRACATLKSANILSYSYVSGSGTFQIVRQTSALVSRIDDRCGRGTLTSKRDKVPENERLALLRGKLSHIAPLEYNKAIGIERKRRLEELRSSLTGLCKLGTKMFHIRTGQFDVLRYQRVVVFPESGIPPAPDIYYHQQPTEEEELRGRYRIKVKDHPVPIAEYEELVKAANSRLDEIYGVNRYIKERELKIFKMTLLDICRMSLAIQEPKPKEDIKHVSAQGIAVNG
jgi:hypothetical protein